jgi:AP endonuclease-1
MVASNKRKDTGDVPEKTIKKAKATPKKKVWEPFDPSLPKNKTFPDTFTIPTKPEGSITIASYNVASLKACINKGFNRYVDVEDADILCLQETKLNEPLSTAVNDKVYKYRYWGFDEKKGYGEGKKRDILMTYTDDIHI